MSQMQVKFVRIDDPRTAALTPSPDWWILTLLKTATLFAVYVAVLAATLTGVFVYAMLQL
jgi:hypothetical protein